MGHDSTLPQKCHPFSHWVASGGVYNLEYKVLQTLARLAPDEATMSSSSYSLVMRSPTEHSLTEKIYLFIHPIPIFDPFGSRLNCMSVLFHISIKV